jgi:hypothetical protein
MRTMKYGLLAGLIVGLLGIGLLQSREEEKPKYTIKEVMKEAHKSGLWKKVADGKASKDEEKKLVEYYTSLAENKPPKGDEAAFKAKATAMLKAAKEAAAGKEEGRDELKKLVKCMDCHKMFK